MGKNVIVAVVSAIIGALLVVIYQGLVPVPPIPGPIGKAPCGNKEEKHCIPVYVIMVGDTYEVQRIGNVEVKDGGPIFWEIVSPGYTFPTTGALKGIDFEKTAKENKAPDGEFSDCAPMPGPNGKDTKFRCTFRGNKGKFPYDVHIDGPGNPKPLDPFIVNG
jgi:hypothetical protein